LEIRGEFVLTSKPIIIFIPASYLQSGRYSIRRAGRDDEGVLIDPFLSGN
jgi:hypothetical protein